MDEATSAPATSAPIWDPLGRILPFPVPALFDARLTATHHQVLLFMAYQSEHSPDGWFEIRQDDMARFLGKETRGAVSRKLLDLCHWPTTDNPYVLRFQQVHASSRMRRANRYRLRFDVSMEDIPPELRRIAPPTGQIPDDDDSQLNLVLTAPLGASLADAPLGKHVVNGVATQPQSNQTLTPSDDDSASNRSDSTPNHTIDSTGNPDESLRYDGALNRSDTAGNPDVSLRYDAESQRFSSPPIERYNYLGSGVKKEDEDEDEEEGEVTRASASLDEGRGDEERGDEGEVARIFLAVNAEVFGLPAPLDQDQLQIGRLQDEMRPDSAQIDHLPRDLAAEIIRIVCRRYRERGDQRVSSWRAVRRTFLAVAERFQALAPAEQAQWRTIEGLLDNNPAWESWRLFVTIWPGQEGLSGANVRAAFLRLAAGGNGDAILAAARAYAIRAADLPGYRHRKAIHWLEDGDWRSEPAVKTGQGGGSRLPQALFAAAADIETDIAAKWQAVGRRYLAKQRPVSGPLHLKEIVGSKLVFTVSSPFMASYLAGIGEYDFLSCLRNIFGREVRFSCGTVQRSSDNSEAGGNWKCAHQNS